MTYKGIGTPGVKATTTGTTVSVPYPTGGAAAAAGEALLLVVSVEDASIPSLPTGWTTGVSGTGTGAQTPGLLVCGIQATGLESGSLVVTVGAVTGRGIMLTITGDFSSGFDVTGTKVTPAANTSFNIPGLTPNQANDTLVIGGTSATAGGSFSPSASLGGFTEVDDAVTGNVGMAIDILEYASASPTGTVVLTRTTSIRSIAWMVAIKPPASGLSGTASVPLTDTVTADGILGAVAGAALALAIGITATGVVGTSGDTSVNETVTVASAGAVGTSTGSGLTLTATITAAGSVTSGLSTGSTVPLTDTVTSAGVVGAQTGTSVPLTDAVTSAGVVGKQTGASLAETATVASTGVVGAVTGATVPETVTILAAGRVGLSSSSAVPVVVSITSAGVVAGGGPAIPYIELIIPARLGTLEIGEVDRTLVVPATLRTIEIPPVNRTLVIPAVIRTIEIPEV